VTGRHPALLVINQPETAGVIHDRLGMAPGINPREAVDQARRPTEWPVVEFSEGSSRAARRRI
jgi:hypothetical protein